MGPGATIVLSVLSVCVTIAFVCYMGFSSDNETGVFSNSDHEKRIKRLEEAVEKLRRNE
ncbi:MAG: hypothetical protein HFI29_05955 [Lachnospiraceae bacterium]|jgi:hypothetical protein|nr:hypothetical protein [Lachnospiraceae bacterium]